jgi:hypothetical protein
MQSLNAGVLQKAKAADARHQYNSTSRVLLCCKVERRLNYLAVGQSVYNSTVAANSAYHTGFSLLPQQQTTPTR